MKKLCEISSQSMIICLVSAVVVVAATFCCCLPFDIYKIWHCTEIKWFKYEFSDNSQLKSLLHRIASEKREKEKIKSASSRIGVHVLAFQREREKKKKYDIYMHVSPWFIKYRKL